jgi:hypothetical protein
VKRWVVTAQRLPSNAEEVQTRPVTANWFVRVPDDDDIPLAALEAAVAEAIQSTMGGPKQGPE